MHILKVKKHELEITYFYVTEEQYEEALREPSPYRRSCLASVIIQRSFDLSTFKIIKTRYDIEDLITRGIYSIVSGAILDADVKKESL